MMNTADPTLEQRALLVLLVSSSSAWLSRDEWRSCTQVSRAWHELVAGIVLARHTTLFTSEKCEQHRIPKRSERPERLRIVLDRCLARFPKIRVVRELPFATIPQLVRFHTELHVDTITRLGTKIESSMAALDKMRLDAETPLLSPRSLALAAAKAPHATTKAISKQSYYAQFEYIDIDDDTVMMRHTVDASMVAAGGVCLAIDHVMYGKTRNAFCVVRPPGHHAEPQRAMGFCFFNNIGVAAFHALDHHKLERVTIIDFDVHHGNGTQKRVERERQIMYVSMHQAPLYPGTGFAHECGDHDNILNIPLKARTTSKTYRELFLSKVWPRVVAYRPQLVLISAGFDAHTQDPLADIRLQSDDYYWITSQIVKMAWQCCDGRVVSVLEGGYHARALGDSAEQHLLALAHGSMRP
uniref:histone deacetylase n=1 Tax=Globisporangium ultimum (strain ATCC 200006 / CBS 805.95 / DAOM BR144) TaxID=431595 RepID=K3WR15_GLOUD